MAKKQTAVVPAKVKMDVNASTSINLNITKDDIILVMQDAEEKRLEELILQKNTELKKIQYSKKEIKKNIEKDILKGLGLNTTKTIKYEVGNILNSEYKRLSLYDIKSLSNKVNIKRLKDGYKTSIYSYNNYKFKSSITVYVKKSEKDFLLQGEKEFDFKPSVNSEKLLKEYNLLNDKDNDLTVEINNLEVDLLYVSNDKSYKVEMIKKIVNASEYSQLILNK